MDINEFFKNKNNLKDAIIVISGKDNVGRYIAKFTEKDNLGIKLNAGFRESYIAVIDNNRKFMWENNDSKLQDISYQVGDKFIDVISAGFDAGNVSSIKIRNNEYSLNHRGLNFAIFHYKSLVLLDNFYVDTHQDETLKVVR